MKSKVVFGYDVHRLVLDRNYSREVKISFPKDYSAFRRRFADSSIDCDRIAWAMGLGDIGRIFLIRFRPYRSISSLKLLAKVVVCSAADRMLWLGNLDACYYSATNRSYLSLID
jgi:2C-methyl-D-erythritol 2,4-cyclodiphosphate synthase